MDEALQRLRRYVTDHPRIAVFEPAAGDAQIADAERALKLPIPDEYKAFLREFDGGFVIRGRRRDDRFHKETEAWNANHLMGCAGLNWATDALKDMFWIDLDVPWQHVGFCHTEDHHFLSFAPPSHPSPGAVLRAMEGYGPEDWEAIYPTFTAFLDAYIRLEGQRDVAWPDLRGRAAAE